MKNYSKKLLLLLLLPATAITLVVGYFIINSSTGPSSSEVKERVASMEALNEDTTTGDELEELVSDSGYKAYENGTNSSRVTFMKESGPDITTKGKVTVKKTVFYFQQDDTADGKSINLIMEKNFEDVSYIVSVHPENANALLVEKKIYNEVDGKITIHYEHYSYDVKENKLTPKREDQDSMDYKEAKEIIDEYLTELQSLY